MILSRLLGQTLAIQDVTVVLLKQSKEIQNRALLLTILQNGYLVEEEIVQRMDHGEVGLLGHVMDVRIRDIEIILVEVENMSMITIIQDVDLGKISLGMEIVMVLIISFMKKTHAVEMLGKVIGVNKKVDVDILNVIYP